MTINDDAFERYQRQIMIQGFGREGQEKLSRASVLIAGVGGLGSPLAMYLAAAGVGRLTIVDLDRVALTNLNRQILHWEDDLGELKTESARAKLVRLNSEIVVDARAVKLTEENAEDLLRGHDLALDALDNHASRKVLNRACQKLGLPLIYGGIDGLAGMISTFQPGRTPCLECLFPGDVPPSAPPVLGATPGVIACLQATEALKILIGLGEPLYNRLLVYDGLSMTFRSLEIRRSERCPVCGDPNAPE